MSQARQWMSLLLDQKLFLNSHMVAWINAPNTLLGESSICETLVKTIFYLLLNKLT